MPWKIKVYIPVEPENEQLFQTEQEADQEMQQLEEMQPENHYELVECDEKGEEV